MSTAPALYRKLPFDPLKDFEPVGLVVDVPMTFVAKKDLPPNDMKELVDYVKENKDKVTLANAGIGAASHLCGMLFMSTIQTDVTTVPYKGTAPAMNDLLGGQVDVMCDQTTNTTSHIKGGKIKVYAVTTQAARRVAAGGAARERGGAARLRRRVWHGVYAPKGTPKPVIDQLTAALQAAHRGARRRQAHGRPRQRASCRKDKATPEGLRSHLKAEIDKWTPIIKKAGVYAD